MLNKIKARLNNKKGFTLVELIVVIVIILILAAVLVPNVTKYVGNAKKASAQSNASAIFTQLEAEYTAYLADPTLSSMTLDGNKKLTVSINNYTVTQDATASDTESPKVCGFTIDKQTLKSFTYTDGKYTCTWSDGAWTIAP